MSALDTYAAAHAPVPSPPAQKPRHNLLNFNFNFKARSKLGRATGGGHNKLKGRGESRRGSGSDLSGLRGVTGKGRGKEGGGGGHVVHWGGEGGDDFEWSGRALAVGLVSSIEVQLEA